MPGEEIFGKTRLDLRYYGCEMMMILESCSGKNWVSALREEEKGGRLA